RHAHPRLRGRVAGGVLSGELPGIRGGQEKAPGRGGCPAQAHPLQAAQVAAALLVLALAGILVGVFVLVLRRVVAGLIALLLLALLFLLALLVLLLLLLVVLAHRRLLGVVRIPNSWSRRCEPCSR